MHKNWEFTTRLLHDYYTIITRLLHYLADFRSFEGIIIMQFVAYRRKEEGKWARSAENGRNMVCCE